MDSSAFGDEAKFTSYFQVADGRTGVVDGYVAFQCLLEVEEAGSFTPFTASDIAGAIRDRLADLGITVTGFSGVPLPEPLDWPEGS